MKLLTLVGFVILLFVGEWLTSAHHHCSDIIKINENGTFILPKTIFEPNDTELQIYFNSPVNEIESDGIYATKNLSRHWILSLEAAELNATEIELRLTAEKEDTEVIKLATDDHVICEAPSTSVNLPVVCHVQDIHYDKSKVITRMAAWSTGRNFRISIPAYPTFVGYVVDIFFTKPVTNINIDAAYKAIHINSTHWVITKTSSEIACIKLVDFFFQVEFPETSDIKAVLLNGEPIVGNGTSKAVFRNTDIEPELNQDCSGFFENTEPPWFGATERAKPLKFVVPFTSTGIGITIDFIFEEAIKEVRVWALRAQRLTSDSWRLHNPGWVLSPGNPIAFPLHIHYYDHYHVKIKGIIINKKILCGLASSSSYHQISDDRSSELRSLMKQDATLDKLYNLILAVLVTSVTIFVSSVIIFALLLRQPKNKVNPLPQHLYTDPSYYSSTSGVSNRSEVYETLHAQSSNDESSSAYT